MSIKKVIDVQANTSQAQKEFDLLDKNIKETDDSILKLERDLLKLEKKKLNTPKQTQAYNDLSKSIQKTRLRLKEERQDSKELKKEKKGLTDATKAQTDATKKSSGAMGLLNKMTGGLAGRFTGMVGSVKSATAGMNAFKIALMSTGIGALVILITSLVAAFKRSEEGQDKLAKGMAMVGAVVNQFMDVLANLGEGIINVFTNPLESIKKFKDFLVQNITNRFNAAIDTVGFLGSAIKKVFSGDFAGAMEDAGKAGSSYIDTLTGVEDTLGKTTKAVKEFGEETMKEVGIMGQIADARAKAHKMERELLTEVAEGRRDINNLRLQAEDREKYSATERIELLRKAQGIEEELANKQIKAKQLVIDAMKQEQALGKTTKEEKDALAKLEAELINLETKKLRGQRLLQTQITTAVNQEKTQKAELVAQEMEQQQMLVDFKRALREAEANTLAEEHALELENNTIKFEELQLQLLEQRELGLVSEEEFEMYKAEIQAARIDSTNDIKIKQAKELADEKKAIAEKELNDEINIMREEEGLRQQKLGGAKSLINGLQNIAMAGGKKSKALAIAGIVVDQISSASQTISNLGIANAKSVAASPLTAGQPMVAINTISAIGSIAAGLSGARKAIANLKSNKQSPEGTSAPPARSAAPSSSVAASETPSPQTPTFGSLGGGGENAIAEALGNQPPVQAFVVSNDVSSAQSLERNIVNQATIG